MRYRIAIKGITGIIMHNCAAGLDNRSPANREKASITAKKGGNRTESDESRLRELETQTSLWLNSDRTPGIPQGAIRAMIEESAKKLKQGPLVREGLVVESVEFTYDKSLGVTPEELAKTVQFTHPVVVQRSRVLRTRAKFEKWGASFVVDVLPEMVDKDHLTNWLKIGGQRIGIGDWRPSRSGQHGTFRLESIEKLED